MAIAPAITSPVEPSIESVSLCVNVLPPTLILRAFSSIVDLAGAGDAAAAPTAGDDRRVAGHAAGAGEDADGRVHAVDVFRVRFLADEQHLLRRRACARPLRRR